MSQRGWEAIAASKRAALSSNIPSEFMIPSRLLPPSTQSNVTTFPKESGWFTAKELEITDSTASHIVQKIASRSWSSEEVTRAFCKRAAAAHQLTNCLSEIFFLEAIKTAKSLDEHLRKTGKVIGPLHGLPLSLKDNFNIVGKDSTVGFASLVNQPATYNATLVELLENAGAVRYCKTNVPTAMMIAESVNNVFGRTVNPLNRNLTSGGSSGGESALIAFGGSPLGVGTDIGGSLRIPAACTGIFTLRPSFGRFTTQRCRSGLAGQEAVMSVNGPMAKTLEDITLFSKTVVDSEPWLVDPKCLPIPWRPVGNKKKLKIAVLWNDGVVVPTPPVTRALKETVEKLKKAGHEIVEWSPTLHLKALDNLGRMFLADGGKSVRALLEPTNEPFRPEMEQYSRAPDLSTYDMWQLQLERSELQRQYLLQWQSIDGLDAILAPTTPFASVANGSFKHVGYTGVYNVVDYSSVSFPSGVTADREKDRSLTNHSPLSETCKEVHEEYDAELVHGMPVSLQLIAKRLEEEKVLAMTRTVLDAIHPSALASLTNNIVASIKSRL
ncbi:amidase signature domain-containing protein [Lophiotrema nucula]|uniref:amidase n=1 Tax=Lophiotrema nucula TaxID=690887 RepID=A0A6A5YKN1_9PLEO|nr:amidase signature domain-containing protein [Lophiotrema nucula]